MGGGEGLQPRKAKEVVEEGKPSPKEEKAYAKEKVPGHPPSGYGAFKAKRGAPMGFLGPYLGWGS